MDEEEPEKRLTPPLSSERPASFDLTADAQKVCLSTPVESFTPLTPVFALNHIKFR